MDEILGRKPTAKPEPAPVAEVAPPPPPEPGPAPVAEAPAPEGDLMSGDDALAWLQSLSAGKEDELRAQAAVESQARVDEILGRKPAAKPEPTPVAEVAPPPPPEPVAVIEQPVVEAAPPPAPEPTLVAEAPVLEVAPELEPVAELPAEPEPVEEVASFGPATRHAKPITPTTDLLEAMRARVEKNPDDHETRLHLARSLWAAEEVKESISHYAYLIRENEKTNLVVEDLRQYVVQRPKDALVLRTLGDAYMNEGLLEQALEIYNQAMNLL